MIMLFTAAVDLWKQRTGHDLPPEFIVTQRAWDTPLVEVAVERVLSAAPNKAGIARLIATPAPHSGAFLQTLPCSAVVILDSMMHRCELQSLCVLVRPSAHHTNASVELTSTSRVYLD